MLSLLEHRWGFAPWVLTIAFAVYALGLLAALLVTGSLSDYVGRRPVMLGALALELVAMVMFAMAPNIGWVIAARTCRAWPPALPPAHSPRLSWSRLPDNISE